MTETHPGPTPTSPPTTTPGASSHTPVAADSPGTRRTYTAATQADLDAPRPVDPEDFDRDVNIRAVLWTTGGVVVMTLAAVVISWIGLKGLNAFETHHADAPPAMQSSREALAPGPQLQPSPPEDMDLMRRSDANQMDHAAWVDRAQGTVRLPINVALDILARQGLPTVTTPSLASTMAHGSYADDGRPPVDQPSPGTLLPPPGMGISNLGVPSAGAGVAFGAAMPGPPVPMGGSTPASAAKPAAAAAVTTAAPAKPAAAPAPKLTPVVTPPPPGGLR